MTPVIVLAYDGECDVRRAMAALRAGRDLDVVTMTVDIGQSRDLKATRDLALAAGAVRAHAFDCVDEFVRRCVLPALQASAAAGPALASQAALAHPVVAARLVEVAHLERTRTVAHGGGESLSAAIRALDPSLHVLTIDVDAGERPRRDARPAVTSARHLLQRPVADPARARGQAATLDIQFDEAVPVSINGVTLALPELIESLSLIGGEHGLGHAEATSAPGALLLDAAYRALQWRSGVVRIELLDGRQRVLAASSGPELVNHA
jgi:argininosuccinate synthase